MFVCYLQNYILVKLFVSYLHNYILVKLFVSSLQMLNQKYIPYYIINCRVLKENYYITIISQLKENYYIIINAEFHVPTGPVYLQKVLHRCHRETKCAP
jgi:hypothetical protein